MGYKVLLLNIFDETIKNIISSRLEDKPSSNHLNKLVLLLKYFIQYGNQDYHFKKNHFVNDFIGKDNRTINKMLDELVSSELITYEMKADEKNPIVKAYSINPEKVIRIVEELEKDCAWYL